jgi:hypothetical protein
MKQMHDGELVSVIAGLSSFCVYIGRNFGSRVLNLKLIGWCFSVQTPILRKPLRRKPILLLLLLQYTTTTTSVIKMVKQSHYRP